MKNVKFYLRDSKDMNVPCAIYAQCCVNGRKMRYSTKLFLKSEFWDEEHQKVRKTFSEHEKFNAVLGDIKTDISNLQLQALFDKKKLDTSKVRRTILLQGEHQSTGFFEIFERFLNDMRTQVSKNRMKDYITVINHLLKYEKENKNKIELDYVDFKFLLAFRNYLTDKQLNWNTVGKYIKVIKRFLNYARQIGIINHTDYQDFTISEKEPEIFYLTKKELLKLMRLKVNSDKLVRVRDLYLFQTFTGQRFGDIQNLRKEDIEGRKWFLYTQKTSEKNCVPLTDAAIKILKKYSYTLPKISNQKMNDNLKELFKVARFNSMVNKYKWIGSERIDNYVPKHQVLSSHCGKKSFVALSMEADMPLPMIMEITGNRSERAFRRYWKLRSDYKQKRTNNIWKKITR